MCGACIVTMGSAKPTENSEAAATSTHLSRFLGPLIKLRHSLPEGAVLDDLVEANVKLGVKNILASHVSVLAHRNVECLNDSPDDEAGQGAGQGGVRPWLGETLLPLAWAWSDVLQVYDMSTGKLKDLGITQKV